MAILDEAAKEVAEAVAKLREVQATLAPYNPWNGSATGNEAAVYARVTRALGHLEPIARLAETGDNTPI